MYKTYWTVKWIDFGMDSPATEYFYKFDEARKFQMSCCAADDPVQHSVKDQKKIDFYEYQIYRQNYDYDFE